MMNGQAIAAQAVGEASLRRALGEVEGPRPGGVRLEGRALATGTDRTARATRP
jgi:hypothetical protein